MQARGLASKPCLRVGVWGTEPGELATLPVEIRAAIHIVCKRLPKLLERTVEVGGVFFLFTFHLLHVFAHVARIASRLRDLNSPDSSVLNRCPPTLTVRKPGDWLAARHGVGGLFSAVTFQDSLECDSKGEAVGSGDAQPIGFGLLYGCQPSEKQHISCSFPLIVRKTGDWVAARRRGRRLNSH